MFSLDLKTNRKKMMIMLCFMLLLTTMHATVAADNDKIRPYYVFYTVSLTAGCANAWMDP